MNNIRRFIVLLVLVTVSSGAYAGPVRSITTVNVEQYSYDDTGYNIGQVAIAELESGLSLVAKAEYEQLPYTSRTKGMAGVVFPLMPYSYMETSYGISVDDEDSLTHHLLVDFYYERSKYLILTGLKSDLSSEKQTLLPSLALRWNWLPRLSSWTKYTTSFDSNDGFDHSLWAETEYGLTEKLFGKLGATVGTYHGDTDGAQETEYSFLGGVAVKPAVNVRISYQYEYLVRQKYDKGTHTVVADIRF